MVVDRFPDAIPTRPIEFYPSPVLVVDDHPANRWVLGKLLERLGIDCRFASDGTEAIAVAGMRRWGAFLMDIEMRRLDGDQAARQLRRLSPYLANAPDHRRHVATGFRGEETLPSCRNRWAGL